jgi:F-type H+-transporting ATPase subunit delta
LSLIGIARNYAETLYALGEKSGNTAAYAELMDAVAGAVEASPRIEAVLMSPRVPKGRKAEVLAAALGDAPREFILFLQAVVRRGRQGLFRSIARELLGLLDLKLNRVRAGVTTARPADRALQAKITKALSDSLKKEVIARFEVEPAVIGGVIVRVGDRVFDGSVRRRATMLRRKLLTK